MGINEEGLDLIRRWEGFKLKAYRCPAGVLTVGYGHTGPDVFPWTEVTRERAEELLRQDVDKAQKAVRSMVSVRLTENQEAALTSFVFNLGAARFAASTLRAKVNQKNWAASGDELLKWRFASVDGKKVELAGLLERRKAERALFLKP